MINELISFFLGVFCGLILMALCAAARSEDE